MLIHRRGSLKGRAPEFLKKVDDFTGQRHIVTTRLKIITATFMYQI